MGSWGQWDTKPFKREEKKVIPVLGPKKPENKQGFLTDYYNEWTIKEAKKLERLHNMHTKRVMDNLRRALKIEAIHDKPLTDKQRGKLIMEPLEYISKSYVKISLADLYRRYRQIRMQALTESLAIVGNGTSQQQNLNAIREKIVEMGEAHKASKQRFKEIEK